MGLVLEIQVSLHSPEFRGLGGPCPAVGGSVTSEPSGWGPDYKLKLHTVKRTLRAGHRPLWPRPRPPVLPGSPRVFGLHVPAGSCIWSRFYLGGLQLSGCFSYRKLGAIPAAGTRCPPGSGPPEDPGGSVRRAETPRRLRPSPSPYPRLKLVLCPRKPASSEDQPGKVTVSVHTTGESGKSRFLLRAETLDGGS